MTALLDVNVLIALGWPNHVHHAAAQRWFTQFSSNGWATTPITEAGYVRISSNRSVMQVSTTPAIAIAQLAAMTSLAGHTFWPDDVPLIVGSAGDRDAVSNHRRVTDCHLIALAARYGGRLVTFDAALADSASAGRSRCCSHRGWAARQACRICGRRRPRSDTGRPTLLAHARSSALLGSGSAAAGSKTVVASASSTNQVRAAAR